MLNTPAGTPALSSTSAKICAEYGASCGGLSTIVQPVASAGSTLTATRSEEHTSELQSLMRTSYAVFCLKKKKQTHHITSNTPLRYLIYTSIQTHRTKSAITQT